MTLIPYQRGNSGLTVVDILEQTQIFLVQPSWIDEARSANSRE